MWISYSRWFSSQILIGVLYLSIWKLNIYIHIYFCLFFFKVGSFLHKYACAPTIQIFIAVNISTCICFIMDSQNKYCHISDSTWSREHMRLAPQLGDSGFQAFYSYVGLLPRTWTVTGHKSSLPSEGCFGTALLPLLEMHSMRVHFLGTTGGSWHWKP